MIHTNAVHSKTSPVYVRPIPGMRDYLELYVYGRLVRSNDRHTKIYRNEIQASREGARLMAGIDAAWDAL